MRDLPKRDAASQAALLSREQARALALEAGFTEAGLVALPHPAEERDAERFEQWVQAGRSASMIYLQRKSEDGALPRSRSRFRFRGRVRPSSALPTITAPSHVPLIRPPKTRGGSLAMHGAAARMQTEPAGPAIITRCSKSGL